MPWKETEPMKERVCFVAEVEEGRFNMSELSERYGVSRKTGYKWWGRYQKEGIMGLQDRSRTPHHSPTRTPEKVAEAILEAKQKHPRWGARTLLPWLRRRHPEVKWPVSSTAQEILKRKGLTEPRRRRRRHASRSEPVLEVGKPHEVLTADFKGEFRTQDGSYCYPLTVADYMSRYLLACQGFASTAGGPVKGVFVQIFREYGLPQAILTDNGTPFASTGLCRLSRLSVWWIRLGIDPVLIQPGHPEQNGRHERMHRTLKEHTTRPPAANRAAQQKGFNRFRAEYNQERPHQALQERTPAEVHRPSERPYPKRLPRLEYPGYFEVRRVGSNGCIRWQGHRLFLSGVLQGQDVGLNEIEDGIWSVCFGSVLLGRYDERQQRLYG